MRDCFGGYETKDTVFTLRETGVKIDPRTPKRDPNQKWPDNLLIVRHGRSQRNEDKDAAKKNGGRADFSRGARDHDSPLIPFGEMQALSLGVGIRKDFCEPTVGGPTNVSPLDIIYCSPLVRTRQTKDRIIEGLGYTPKVVYDERLREIEFGLLDGLDRRGIEVKYPEELVRREREGKYWYRAPGGENRPDVRLRLRSFLDTLVRDAVGLNVLVVCHSVVVLAFRAVLERWEEGDYMEVDKEDDVKNASLTRYSYEEVGDRPNHKKLVLKEYNTIFYTE